MISRSNIYQLGEYADHLKNLTKEDRASRFGHAATDHAIDQLILNMVYNPDDHQLWRYDGGIGWGHLAKGSDNHWELAVSVNSDSQGQGIGNKLISAMLTYAKFHGIEQIYMHCIYENKVIQHLAKKNDLVTRERGYGEQTAAIELGKPNIIENSEQLWKEQTEILNDIGKLRLKLTELWAKGLPF